MAKAISKDAGCEPTKNTKPKRKTKLERTTEAQLFLEQDELQRQLEAEDTAPDAHEPEPVEVATSAEVHEPHFVRRLRKL